MPRSFAKLVAVCTLLGAAPATGAPLASNLIDGLRHGGYVLVMRHAHAPARPPDKGAAHPGNIKLERQLDGKGRIEAESMGRAFKAMHIPVGMVFSSPTYRARETIRLAGLGPPQTIPELGDQGRSMQPLNGSGPSAWLRARAIDKPAPGKNTVIVTQMPNIAAAFPNDAKRLQDGETLVFKPDGQGHTQLVAKIPIEDW